MAGDIYVYYIEKDGQLYPEFYIKVTEFRTLWTNEKRNSILFNNCSLGYDGIDNKYLSELILKLREMDEEKNSHYIEELEVRYKNYQRLLSLDKLEKFEEDDLIFLYEMAYIKREELAFSKVINRDIQKDYDIFSSGGKVKLFLAIKKSDISNRLSINSREILLKLAENRCLKQLNNASEDIINDKEYILKLLDCFFTADKNTNRNLELNIYLPQRYQADIDVLELIFYKYILTPLSLNDWMRSNPKLKENMKKPEFLYRLVDSFVRGLMKEGEPYYECGLMDLLTDEVLDDIENHILIGPESTQENEDLKNRSINVMKIEREKVKTYRLKRNNN